MDSIKCTGHKHSRDEKRGTPVDETIVVQYLHSRFAAYVTCVPSTKRPPNEFGSILFLLSSETSVHNFNEPLTRHRLFTRCTFCICGWFKIIQLKNNVCGISKSRHYPREYRLLDCRHLLEFSNMKSLKISR